MMRNFLALLALALAVSAGAASAQSCGGVYTVARGDSLSFIALDLYKDAGKWTALHQSNIATIGANPDHILVGQKLWVTCIAGLPQGLETGVVQIVENSGTSPQETAEEEVAGVVLMAAEPTPLRKIKLVTEDNFAPFTDPDGGLVTDVIQAALSEIVGPDGFEVYRINDPATHLDPLLTENLMDVALAWSKPDCIADPGQEACGQYLYSDPAFEHLILLFYDKSRPVPFTADADIIGRTLCRPVGYLTHMLDQNGRNWVADDKVTLVRADTVDGCFEKVLEGNADAVIINEFTGRSALARLGIGDQFETGLNRPVAITTLHAVVSQENPNAELLVGTLNRGLEQIRKNGAYRRIVDSHMTRFWAGF